MNSKALLTIAIPSFGREQVLLSSLSALLDICDSNSELLLVDQTLTHDPEVEYQLNKWQAQGLLRWIRQSPPSIAAAMNRALLEAKGDHVLFLDDDIQPDPDLLRAYLCAIEKRPGALIAGRVLQPWHGGRPDSCSAPFAFNSLKERQITEFIGCNFCVPCCVAIAIGGFDQNFEHVAYRFEAEFAHRWRLAGYSMHYEPTALIHHLKAERGGTRSYGQHLTTAGPSHAVGRYYFLLRTMSLLAALLTAAGALARSVCTRHHLRHPWWIPITLLAELRGLVWAMRLHLKGPKLLQPSRLASI